MTSDDYFLEGVGGGGGGGGGGEPLLPPTANDDAYSTTEDQTLSVSASGVLGNDTDPQNYNLTAILNSNPSNGTLSLNSDGLFTYTPNTGYTGSDSFTYYANDGVQDSNVATVTIDVNPAAATQFVVTAPSSTTAGNSFDFTVTAEDPFGNTDTNYSGTVGFQQQRRSGHLAGNGTLTNGMDTFSATLYTAGPQTLTATDTGNSTITGHRQYHRQSRRRHPARRQRPEQHHGGQQLRLHRYGRGPLRQHRHELQRHGRLQQQRRPGDAAGRQHADQRRRHLQRHLVTAGPRR